MRTPDELRDLVRAGYSESRALAQAAAIAEAIGYTRAQLDLLPAGANLGFGCGNPVASAGLQPAEVVVDLGCGAGIDVVLAALAVGPKGRVIGVDMTPHMLEQARAAAANAALDNVTFIKGVIEALGFIDASIDVVISNGVINLSPERHRVFAEVARVLKPTGRMIVADLAFTGEIDASLASIAQRYLGNLVSTDDYLAAVSDAGLTQVRVVRTLAYGLDVLSANDVFVNAALEAGASETALAAFFPNLTANLVTASCAATDLTPDGRTSAAASE